MNVSIPEHFMVCEIIRVLHQPEDHNEYKKRNSQYFQTNEELLEHIADGIIPILNCKNPMIFKYIETLYGMQGIVSWEKKQFKTYKTYKTVINFVALQKEFTKRHMPLYNYDSEIPADTEFIEFIRK